MKRRKSEQEIPLLDATTIITLCKDKELNEVPKCSLVSDCLPPPRPTRRLKLQLSPVICEIENVEEAFSSELQEVCLEHPISVIRGLTTTLNINLDLFSSKTIVELNPNLSIEVREQIKYTSDENWDEMQNKKVWNCFSSVSYTTLSEYMKYQAKTFLEYSQTSDGVPIPDSSSRITTYKNNQTLKFATNIDLSSVQKWKLQLNELTKLPPFLRVEYADNMLSHVGHDILGMNTVQLYMKIPGCRTPGHQENNNFCSVNINIGPGDCEWFAVSHEYWGVIHKFCEQNGIDYLRDSWWPPDLQVLYEENIPVYRFCQKPGDIVWVNVGCVHWVHAIGWCNNIAWNVGPLIAKQYQVALERYEWNKLQQYQSIVPMVHLSWNLARNVKVSNLELFQLIKKCLMQTMKQNYLTLEFLKHKGVKVEHYRHQNNDYTTYCEDCYVEVFNILFCKKKKEKLVVYCMDCALKQSSSLKEFSCFYKCYMKDLMDIYDNFILTYH